MNANDQKSLEKVHKSLSLVSQDKVDERNNTNNLHTHMTCLHFSVTWLQTLQSKLSHSLCILLFVHWHNIFSCFLHSPTHLTSSMHTHTHRTIASGVSIAHEFFQVLAHLSMQIIITDLHCHGTFTLSLHALHITWKHVYSLTHFYEFHSLLHI